MLQSWFNKEQTPEVFCKKKFVRSFAKYLGKDMFQSLFFKKLRLANLQIY